MQVRAGVFSGLSPQIGGRSLIPALTLELFQTLADKSRPPRPEDAARPVALWSGPAYGTRFSIHVPDHQLDPLRASGQLEALEQALLAELAALDAFASPFKSDSFVSAFARAKTGSRHKVPDAFRPLMDLAFDLSAHTNGAFHPALGHAVAHWGFGAKAVAPGLPAALTQTLPTLSDLYAAGHLIQTGGVEIDLCGIAKGYAVDQVAHLLDRQGIEGYLIEIGGELRAKGLKPDLQPWWVEIEDPSAQGPIRLRRLCLALGLTDAARALATSGDSVRAFEVGGRRYSHTLDPNTLAPISDQMAQVSVVADTCAKADALATALLVMGPEAGLTYAAQNNIMALFLTRQPKGVAEQFSPALKALLLD